MENACTKAVAAIPVLSPWRDRWRLATTGLGRIDALGYGRKPQGDSPNEQATREGGQAFVSMMVPTSQRSPPASARPRSPAQAIGPAASPEEATLPPSGCPLVARAAFRTPALLQGHLRSQSTAQILDLVPPEGVIGSAPSTPCGGRMAHRALGKRLGALRRPSVGRGTRSRLGGHDSHLLEYPRVLEGAFSKLLIPP